MKSISKLICLIAALALIFSVSAFSANAGNYSVGDKIDDFTVTTYTGEEFTLSEVLAEKDMVLINIWATWCNPCRMEFPFMQKAYSEYSDRIEIIALTDDSTAEEIADFAAENGLTFPMAYDSADLGNRLGAVSIPTTAVVDRNGVICMLEAGALTDTDSFRRIFDIFTDESYSAPLLLDAYPSTMPVVEPSSPDELFAALYVDGAEPVFSNGSSIINWPMTVSEFDGRSVAATSNTGIAGSFSSLNVSVDAKAGDAIAVTFLASTEKFYDRFEISLNGERVKLFTGKYDWMTYAVPVTVDGPQELTLKYAKDASGDMGDDVVMIDSVQLLTGEAAAAALAANPFYPVADATSIQPMSNDAQRIEFTDPYGILLDSFSDYAAYIVPGESADFIAKLTPDIDPDVLFIYSNYDGSYNFATDCITDEGYVVTTGIDSMATTGYCFTALSLVSDIEGELFAVLCFADAENVDEFIAGSLTGSDGVPMVSWDYAASAPEVDIPAGAPASKTAAYTLCFTDQHGMPVEGVMAQVCDASVCMVYTSDADGVCAFELEPGEYELHLLMLPEGYTGDTEAVYPLPADGGEMTVEVTKD